ncbi:nicotinamide-nucleotide amidase/nicotinamide-nucleotide amidase [Cryobacterium psychrotolerans]|uniref:Nicotinamide-nucleotide amidase/nicotinamide-nucleotide amidase n=1 Tax=Cryobacterium psychrotolerans TaxID=386301 RepID=A0A1G9HU77_9MICO|nr:MULTISPECIES: CinA family protein [Cryobacterium]TFD45799.1 CinA family protein [Cryobacterium sp. TMT1-2-1]TFD85715.1 CinA family protein [Cryobacterium psychrotolerans]SDL16385.1 nicotinamide-nucleotide amidase/nicotinamide-nucleotide amidase [Cryobacterium psychrotolerans]
MDDHGHGTDHELAGVAKSVAAAVQGRNHTVVAAESVTAGNIARTLAAAPETSGWFRGSIVAYQTMMKRQVLGVAAERIITAQCAQEMAEGALRLTGADLVVAVTGVGGPEPEEGQPAGTVYICAGDKDHLRSFVHQFEGDPETVVHLATLHALQHLMGAALSLKSEAQRGRES